MGRYENTRIKKSNIIRGEKIKKSYNITSHSTTIYSSIPETDDDIFIITQMGDRLDTLAAQFYNDPRLWWYIAKANSLTFITVPTGTSIRIPGNTQYAIGK